MSFEYVWILKKV